MKKLLCPIDFSEVSLNALEFAAAIGEKEHSQMTLLNVFTPMDFNAILGTEKVKESYEGLLETAESKLKAVAAEITKIGKKKGLQSCDYLLKSGKTIDVLAQLADEEMYDLIVMGTTGHSAYDEKYLGGKAQSIIRHTHCSVLCIPENQSFHGMDKIVYATDYQEEDKLAIQQLMHLATLFGAEVEILHVSHHNDTIDKALFEEFQKELRGFVHEETVSFNRVVFDKVALGLDAYMKDTNADLLVLLSKKANFLQSLFQRSLVQHLNKFADYPLLVYKL